MPASPIRQSMQVSQAAVQSRQARMQSCMVCSVIGILFNDFNLKLAYSVDSWFAPDALDKATGANSQGQRRPPGQVRNGMFTTIPLSVMRISPSASAVRRSSAERKTRGSEFSPQLTSMIRRSGV